MEGEGERREVGRREEGSGEGCRVGGRCSGRERKPAAALTGL